MRWRGITPLRRRLLLLMGAIAIVYTYGVVGHMVLNYSFLDALFNTTMELTTLGFSPDSELDTPKKIFTMSLVGVGVATFLIFVTVLVQVFAEEELRGTARRRRMHKQIGSLKDHYIICAYGRVGRAAAREFEAEGVAYVAIDIREELEEQMRQDGSLYLIGDPSREEILRQARIDTARGLVCAVDSDATNVYITLTARSMNPDVFIVARAAEPKTAELLLKGGANRVVSPYATSGRHMALLSVRQTVLESLAVSRTGSEEIRIDELVVEADSGLVGAKLGIACTDADPLVLRRFTGEIVARPTGEEILNEGDLILVLGEAEALKRIESSDRFKD